jgi:tRNA-2-methylthio-N6-dimethylallyladenosine synthase
MSQKAFIKSYGCQMNVYDSERMADILAKQGYTTTEKMEEAEVVVLNTCHIREKASEKVYSELGRVRVLKEERARVGLATRIVVSGCVAQAEGAEIFRRQQAVDVVVGPQSYHHLPHLLAKAEHGETAIETEFPAQQKFAAMPLPQGRRGVSAFLTIQEGCDKFCTFCVVPYTRGAEVSRPVLAILNEARALLENGTREITLIGQNVNAWHGQGLDGREWTFTALLEELAKLPDLKRLRYTTSHPNDMEERLIYAHRDLPVLMPYLHLPVQSGSDRILKAMNRNHSRDDYRRILNKVREARPDIALSSDFIVGFPGETECDFQDTLDLVEEIGFAASFSFKYSPRPGTPAADRHEQIAEPLKTERLTRLQALLEEQRQRFNRASLGKTLEVLVEKPGRNPGQMGGKSPWLQAVHFSAPHVTLGEVVRITITDVRTNSLDGDIQEKTVEAA